MLTRLVVVSCVLNDRRHERMVGSFNDQQCANGDGTAQHDMNRPLNIYYPRWSEDKEGDDDEREHGKNDSSQRDMGARFGIERRGHDCSGGQNTEDVQNNKHQHNQPANARPEISSIHGNFQSGASLHL